jgi:glucose uptake protein
MFIIESYPLAVVFCVITMICWGSWANTQKLAGNNWRFELFYWDYVIGILLLSLIFAFTLGSNGEQGRNFMDDMRQADSGNLLSSFIGGVLFNAANILLVAAIAIAGMSVAFPVGIGIALVLGVVVNYIAVPEGNAAMLFAGVLLVAVAIVLNALAYRRLSRTTAAPSTKGLVLSIVAGILMGFFYGFVANSMVTDYANPESGKLTPYSAMVCFAVGILLSNFLFNTYIMKKPFVGSPVSFADYFRGSTRNHISGILGGMIWCVGMSFSIIAAGAAGAAISYGLGQGATVVAAIWGIFVWKEFRNAPKGTSALLAVMFLSYIIGLIIIIFAK